MNNVLKEKTERNYGVDLLRIIAMIMVVTHHFLGHGGVLENVENLTVNWFLVWFARTVCYISVTTFYLISSFYQSKKSLGIKQIVNIWGEVIFYSVFCFIFSCIIGWKDFSVVGVLKATFPVAFRQYGFFNGYLLLAFLSPFINRGLFFIGKKEHFRIIILLSVLVCIIPYFSRTDAFNLNYGEGILWLLLIYLTGAFLGKYDFKKMKALTYIWMGGFLCVLQFLIKVVIAIATKIVLGEVLFSNAFLGETPFICFGASVFIFLGFEKMGQRVHCKKGIKFCAPMIFSVFLLHENNNIKYHLWRIINPGKYANSPIISLICIWLLVVVTIFIVSFVIDFVRQKVDRRFCISESICNLLLNILIKQYVHWEEKICNGIKEKESDN